MSQSPLDPYLSASLPNIKFNISSTAVTAKPRKMKMTWSTAAADDLRAWTWPRRPDNVLDVLKDALEDPNYDPNAGEDYKGLWRHEDGRIATHEEVMAAHPEMALIADMADEMRAEIDREIAATLSAGVMFNPDIVEPTTAPLTIPVAVRNAIELTPVPRHMKDAAIKSIKGGMRRLENLP